MTFQDQFFAGKTTPVSAKPGPKAKPAAATQTATAPALATQTAPGVPAYRNRSTLAYAALLSFSFLYYARPEDFVPGLSHVPVAKISGGLALLGLLLSWQRQRVKIPIEIKLVVVMFVHLCLTIPFAWWRGGAADIVINEFSKAAMVALLCCLIVTSLQELCRLLWVQACAMTMMTIASILVNHGTARRMWGLGGVFSNPNDLAINIAINFPLCVAFLLGTKGIFRKLLWTVGILAMVYGVIATYSRSGFIAMMICFIICVWKFGVRGKRPPVLIAAVVMLTLVVGLAITTPKYTARLKTLVGGDTTGTMDHGSLDARRDVLIQSIQVTFAHPIFGVGPGNFQAYTKTWHVTHNTYTELSSETGLAGLGWFLAILFLTFRNLRRTTKSRGYKANPQIQLFASALSAAMAAYVVAAAFASTGYSLFPYFMVGYVSALYRISLSEGQVLAQAAGASALDRNRKQMTSSNRHETALAGTR